jgi:hypothetical protein
MAPLASGQRGLSVIAGIVATVIGESDLERLMCMPRICGSRKAW